MANWFKNSDYRDKEILKEPSATKKRNLENYEKGMFDNKTRFEKQFGGIKTIYKFQDILLKLVLENRDYKTL